MKRYWIHIICLFGLFSCTETYPGLSLDMSGDDIDWGPVVEVDSTVVTVDSIPVILSMIDPSFTNLNSKASVRAAAPAGSGAFDHARPDSMHHVQWQQADFHVFGILNSDEAAFDVPGSVDSRVCMIDNDVARVADMNSFLMTFNNANSAEAKTYYFPSSEGYLYDRYNFYAYYLDNLEPTQIERTKDSINVHFEMDGSQDILTGYARLTKKQEADLETREEGDSLRDYHYSGYTAKHMLFPVLDMDHELTRMKFYIYPGVEGCDSVIVEKVEVRSKYKGHLTVAHRDPTRICAHFDAAEIWLTLRDEGTDTALDTDSYYAEWKPEYARLSLYDRPSKQLGESMLLAPAMAYELKLTTRTKLANNQVRNDVTTYDLTNDEMYKPNYEYRVRIGLYGPTEMTVSAVLSGWKYGGEVNVEGDNVFEY